MMFPSCFWHSEAPSGGGNFSRHRNQGVFRAPADGLEGFLARVKDGMMRASGLSELEYSTVRLLSNMTRV